MRKKKKIVRKRKNNAKRYSLSKRAKLIIGIFAAAMFLCTFSVFYVVLGSYDGLGLPQSVEENEYDMESLSEEDGFLVYDDENYRSLKGVDVSYYQKEIDWEKVKKSGIDFAMIRLGYRGSEEGKLYTDSCFRANVKGAGKAGLKVGVYFFSQAVNVDEAVEEAKYVIRRIRGKDIEFPVVFDMEPVSDDGRISDLTVREKTEIADAFCRIIEMNGYEAMIYGNPHWLETSLDLSYLTDYDVWLAHYTEVTNYPYQYVMWQYTESGKVDGISGKTDLNLFFTKKDKKESDG